MTTGDETTAASSPGSRAPAGEGDPDASVVVGAVLEPESLDILHQAGAAIDQVLLDNVYETLLTTAEDGSTIEPGLADVPDDLRGRDRSTRSRCRRG